MITFILCIACLIAGYFLYGKFVDKFFGTDPSRKTPAFSMEDGVDFKPMATWKVFVIQFLNIAGLGPIFGAIMGAAYGPAAYIWIVIGCIFMGAVHDFFSGMMSIRNGGVNMPDIIGKNLGSKMKVVMNVVVCFLLLAIGVSFVTGPADLVASLTGVNKEIWLYVIFAYYIIATLLPIDKIIGNYYCKIIKIKPEGGKMRICADGEVESAGETTFEILHDAMNFVVPHKLSEKECTVQTV